MDHSGQAFTFAVSQVPAVSVASVQIDDIVVLVGDKLDDAVLKRPLLHIGYPLAAQQRRADGDLQDLGVCEACADGGQTFPCVLDDDVVPLLSSQRRVS